MYTRIFKKNIFSIRNIKIFIKSVFILFVFVFIKKYGMIFFISYSSTRIYIIYTFCLFDTKHKSHESVYV